MNNSEIFNQAKSRVQSALENSEPDVKQAFNQMLRSFRAMELDLQITIKKIEKSGVKQERGVW